MKLHYLDDMTLGGQVDAVASDITEIAEVGGDMELFLNFVKCELVAHQGVWVRDKQLQSLQRVEPKDATLLGAALFSGPVLNQALVGSL